MNKKQAEKEKVTEGREKEMMENQSYAVALGVQPTGSTRDKNSPEVEALNFKYTWARQLSQANLEQQLKMATEAAKRMEDKNGDVFKASKTPAKQNRLGNSLDRHSEQDWAWEENDADWEGTTDRQAKNRERKMREEKKKRERTEKAAYIGRCTIGIGPIRQESTDYFNKITADYGSSQKNGCSRISAGIFEI